MNLLKNQKSTTIFALTAVLFLITCLNFQSVTASIELELGNLLSYEVLEASDTENVFYGASPTFNYFGNWSVTAGDFIQFLIMSVTEANISGYLFLGNSTTNTTFINVRNVDTAFGLTISIGTWNGGFFANASDWQNIQSMVQSTNTTTEEVRNFEHSISDAPKFYDVMKFDTVDYYGQYTTLYYHSTSGVLLKGITSFGFYNLSIELRGTNLEIEGFTKRVSMDFSYLILITAFVPILRLMKKRFVKTKR